MAGSGCLACPSLWSVPWHLVGARLVTGPCLEFSPANTHPSSLLVAESGPLSALLSSLCGKVPVLRKLKSYRRVLGPWLHPAWWPCSALSPGSHGRECWSLM